MTTKMDHPNPMQYVRRYVITITMKTEKIVAATRHSPANRLLLEPLPALSNSNGNAKVVGGLA